MAVRQERRYAISVAARMVGVRAHTLRYYEKIGIIEPTRSKGNIRLYSDKDVAHLRQLKALVDELGINLAAVEVVSRMGRRISELQQHVRELESELERLHNKKEVA